MMIIARERKGNTLSGIAIAIGERKRYSFGIGDSSWREEMKYFFGYKRGESKREILFRV
jgi:hypothetical protein